ncbi:hypothetical protein PS1_003187 [Malus domestica]
MSSRRAGSTPGILRMTEHRRRMTSRKIGSWRGHRIGSGDFPVSFKYVWKMESERSEWRTGQEPDRCRSWVLRRTRRLSGMNLKVWDSKENDSASERMKSAASRSWGFGWAVLTRRSLSNNLILLLI